jgi:hypothetical protein
MDARIPERLPVLPVLARTAAQYKAGSAAPLEATQAAAPGELFTVTGQTLHRVTGHGQPRPRSKPRT